MEKELLELTRKSAEAEASISKSMESLDRTTDRLASITQNQNVSLETLKQSMTNLNDTFGLHTQNTHKMYKRMIYWIIVLTMMLISVLGGTKLLQIFRLI